MSDLIKALQVRLSIVPDRPLISPEKVEAMNEAIAETLRHLSAFSLTVSAATAGLARLAQEFERKKLAETIRSAVVHRDLDMVHRLALLRRS